MPRRNLWIILLAVFVCVACYSRAEHSTFSRHLAHAYQRINDLALQDPPDRALFDAAMEGMVARLDQMGDEHSEYISAADAAAFNVDIRQEFGGIGVVIMMRGREEPRELVVVSPPEPGGPAADHDIRGSDQIVAIDGVPVETLNIQTTDDAIRHIRGPIGKPVKLTILHAGESTPVDIDVVRGRISIDSVLGIRKQNDATWQFRLDEHPNIAYIRITTFGEKTVSEVYTVLDKLVREGIQGVILDLRDNPGGELQGTISICDMFVPAGATIVETRDRRGRVEEVFRATSETPFADLPLAVLINHVSASASEILAACLQDHGRAVVIGRRSFGKGTVQRVLNVGPMKWQRHDEEYQSGLLKLTASSYWRPSGKNIHRIGDGRLREAADDKDPADWGVSPDPGMTVELSPHEREAFFFDRRERELYNPFGDAYMGEPDDLSPEAHALLPFQDEAIAKAVEYLKAQ